MTRPEIMSYIPGTVRVLTPTASAARTTWRTSEPGARGIAITTSSISCGEHDPLERGDGSQDRQVAQPVAVLRRGRRR